MAILGHIWLFWPFFAPCFRLKRGDFGLFWVTIMSVQNTLFWVVLTPCFGALFWPFVVPVSYIPCRLGSKRGLKRGYSGYICSSQPLPLKTAYFGHFWGGFGGAQICLSWRVHAIPICSIMRIQSSLYSRSGCQCVSGVGVAVYPTSGESVVALERCGTPTAWYSGTVPQIACIPSLWQIEGIWPSPACGWLAKG